MAEVELVGIQEDELEAFLEQRLPDYVRARAEADGVSLEAAERAARRQQRELLPQGFHTPGHYFFRIAVAGVGNVGALWLHADAVTGECWIFDIEIEPRWRRRGYASATLGRAETHARAQGCQHLALNVFAANPAARALYGKLGFEPVAITMRKLL